MSACMAARSGAAPLVASCAVTVPGKTVNRRAGISRPSSKPTVKMQIFWKCFDPVMLASLAWVVKSRDHILSHFQCPYPREGRGHFFAVGLRDSGHADASRGGLFFGRHAEGFFHVGEFGGRSL